MRFENEGKVEVDLEQDEPDDGEAAEDEVG